MEIQRCFLEHLRPVGREVLGGHDSTAFLHFLRDEFRCPTLVETGRTFIGDEAQGPCEFGEVEDGGAAELAVDPGKLAAGAEVAVHRPIAAHERMDLADVEQLVPGHCEAAFRQLDRGLQDTGPIEAPPALVHFPHGGNGARDACREMPFLAFQILCPRRFVVLEPTRVVDLEHVLARSSGRPQVAVDRHQAACPGVEAGKACVTTNAALGRFDDKTRKGCAGDGIEGIASSLQECQCGCDRISVSGRDNAVPSTRLAASGMHAYFDHDGTFQDS